MVLKNTSPAVDYPRTPRWWAVPLVATIAILVTSVTTLVAADGRNSRQGTGIAVYFLILLSFFTLCGMWAAAAFPTGKTSRPDRVAPAVFGFAFLAAVFLVGATRIAFA
ncbi:hypothetical protein ABH920_003646 [Catenulispora sp. EB89]|uniref:hypothetical protein n=1 Tax=Catenulispora sp. EB89 TaxID=3156257 RepID=UPI0035119658